MSIGPSGAPIEMDADALRKIASSGATAATSPTVSPVDPYEHRYRMEWAINQAITIHRGGDQYGENKNTLPLDPDKVLETAQKIIDFVYTKNIAVTGATP